MKIILVPIIIFVFLVSFKYSLLKKKFILRILWYNLDNQQNYLILLKECELCENPLTAATLFSGVGCNWGVAAECCG